MSSKTQPTRTSKRTLLSWCLYDFANSPFTTLMVTFVYSAFFAEVIVGDKIHGTALWSRGITVTAITVALLSPILGALADRGGLRKMFLLFFTTLCIGATAALFWVDMNSPMKALAIFVLANIAYELGCVFYNALLPGISTPKTIGRVSGYGWGLGYFGGLLSLVIALVMLIQPETPWFGFTKDNGENIRAICLLVAAWFAVFTLPIFLWVKDKPSASVSNGSLKLSETFKQLKATFHELRKYKNIVRLLLARMFYNDGIVTIFAFAGIYAKTTFGFTFTELMLMGIFINVAAGLGAFTMGFLDDYLGGKRTIQISLVGLSIAALMATLAVGKPMLWGAGILAGVFSGPNQSASRSLMGRLVPKEKESEFFGFFAFSGKMTAFMGPFLFGVMTTLFNTQRAGVAIVLVFFGIGAWILKSVDDQPSST